MIDMVFCLLPDVLRAVPEWKSVSPGVASLLPLVRTTLSGAGDTFTPSLINENLEMELGNILPGSNFIS